jgi:uncharacterized protein (TIGR02284 family)
MNTSPSTVASVLHSLIETCKDGQEGFQKAAENVRTPDLKALFSALATQRQEFVSQLHDLARRLGEDAESAGPASVPHRGWMDLKSTLISGGEHAILAECERGEDAAVAEYRGALDRKDLPPNVRSVLHLQSIELIAAHDRLRNLYEGSNP